NEPNAANVATAASPITTPANANSKGITMAVRPARRSAIRPGSCRANHAVTRTGPPPHPGPGRLSRILPGVREADHSRNDVRLYSCVAQPGGVLAGRRAELAAVLAAELRRAVVADGMSDLGDAAGIRHQGEPRLLEANGLLVLDRRHAGHRAEVTMERSRTHARHAGELLDRDR